MKRFVLLGIAFMLIGIVCVLVFTSDDDNNDQAKTVNKDGGIEIALGTRHIDSLKDELTTHYKVWRKGSLVREYAKKDTVPSLDTFTTEGENDNGDTKNIAVKKDYEFYVTVK
jgi:hypothetical protein